MGCSWLLGACSKRCSHCRVKSKLPEIRYLCWEMILSCKALRFKTSYSLTYPQDILLLSLGKRTEKELAWISWLSLDSLKRRKTHVQTSALDWAKPFFPPNWMLWIPTCCKGAFPVFVPIFHLVLQSPFLSKL